MKVEKGKRVSVPLESVEDSVGPSKSSLRGDAWLGLASSWPPLIWLAYFFATELYRSLKRAIAYTNSFSNGRTPQRKVYVESPDGSDMYVTQLIPDTYEPGRHFLPVAMGIASVAAVAIALIVAWAFRFKLGGFLRKLVVGSVVSVVSAVEKDPAKD